MEIDEERLEKLVDDFFGQIKGIKGPAPLRIIFLANCPSDMADNGEIIHYIVNRLEEALSRQVLIIEEKKYSNLKGDYTINIKDFDFSSGKFFLRRIAQGYNQ